MNSYIKSGIVEGTKIMAFFVVISMVWALVIHASNQAGVSPGYAMLGIFTVVIYGATITAQKLKYEIIQKVATVQEDYDQQLSDADETETETDTESGGAE